MVGPWLRNLPEITTTVHQVIIYKWIIYIFYVITTSGKSSNHGPASGCTMLRSARVLRLPRSFIPRHGCCYSTAPVPAETLLTPEIEKGDQAREIELRTKQAPNRSKTWAPSQRPRSDAFNHPRFEGAILEMQVRLGLYCRLNGVASAGSCN
jgi:hypothetical protein